MMPDTRALDVLPPSGSSAGYRFLNTDGGWPSLRPEALSGLVVAGEDNALELVSLPGNSQSFGPELLSPAMPIAGIAGVAVDANDNVYLSDLASDLIHIVDGCDGRSQPLRCLGGSGSEPGRLRTPRGLAVGPQGQLYVADAGNHRVQVVDLGTLQLRAVWGQPDPNSEPRPSDAPGHLNDPWDVAVDSAGYLYVADHGNGRVQKLDTSGRAVPAFWETVAAQEVAPHSPVSLALTGSGQDERLLVVDGDGGRVLAYTLEAVYDAAATAPWQAAAGNIVCVRAIGGLLYAGCLDGRLRVLTTEGVLQGEVTPFGAGAIAGMAVDCRGWLLVRQAAGAALRLEPGTAFLRCGVFLAGPLTVGHMAAAWQRVSATASLPDGTSAQLFTLSSDAYDGGSPTEMPPMPVSCSGSAPAAAVLPGPGEVVLRDTWRAAPAGALDFLALSLPGRHYWVAGVLQSTGAATPRLSQVRVEFNHESWMRYLPSVYRRGDLRPSFAEPAMLLLESAFDDLEAAIDTLPRLFDPAAAPDEGALSSWLDWLAGWLALELQEDWPEEKRRDAVARAFAAHGRRGTVESLKELVDLYADVRVHISEPALTLSIWSLGETSTLGADTMLASAHADGAIVGSTSTLGQAHLNTDPEYGAPLFEDVAHRFCVSAYAVDMQDAAKAARVREVLDREKPAHTTYELSTIDALMRVGVQSQIGIDTIVGEVTGELAPGAEGSLGYDSILPPLPNDAPAMIGKTTSLGRSLTVG